jgi:hypothetical protein
VSLGDLWVKSMNLVWLGVSSGGVDNTSSGSLSSWLGIELNIFVLDEMEFISFHGDIFSKIFKSEERRRREGEVGGREGEVPSEHTPVNRHNISTVHHQ